MSSPEAAKLTRAFVEELNDVAGIHAMAVVGIIKMAELAETFPAPSPDSTLFVGHGDPNTDAGFAYQRWPIKTLASRLAPEGPVFRALGQQWVVMVASKWNDEYRPSIADALDLEKNELKDVALADLTRMRNDIVHHRGIATKRNTGRCELFKWFAEGEPIHPMPEHVAQLMAHMGAIQTTADVEPQAAWEERYEIGEDQPEESAGRLTPPVLDALTDVCGFLPSFVDDGSWEPDGRLERLMVNTLTGARRVYETMIWLVRLGETEQAAALGETLFRAMLLANWLVLNRGDPDWLLDRRAAYDDALLLYYRDTDGARTSGLDLSRLDGRAEELREIFGESAARSWWMVDRDGSPLAEVEIIERLDADETFCPRLHGDARVLDDQHAALSHMNSLPPISPDEAGGPNQFRVLFSGYWAFGQTIFAALELGAPGAIEQFDKIFISGTAVFGEAIGVPSPYTEQIEAWGREAAERSETDTR